MKQEFVLLNKKCHKLEKSKSIFKNKNRQFNKKQIKINGF